MDMIKHIELCDEERLNCFQRIKQLLRDKNAILIAHFYTCADIQQLADESGGFVGDSLDMAIFGKKSSAEILIIAGVRFMGETAKILNPNKKILLQTLAADCSLSLCCPPSEFEAFCKQHPDRTVVVYANTSAEVKALADWIVTSSIAIDVVEHLKNKGRKVIWASDRYLGKYIQKRTGVDMLIWPGSCVVHEKFTATSILKLKKLYPTSAVLVHPESPPAVSELADVVGSTSKLLEASKQLPNKIFIVATESGILYKMRQQSPGKDFITAPTGGVGATCKSCAICPWMAMNTLQGMEKCLITETEEVLIADKIIEKATFPLSKMLNFLGRNRTYSIL